MEQLKDHQMEDFSSIRFSRNGWQTRSLSKAELTEVFNQYKHILFYFMELMQELQATPFSTVLIASEWDDIFLSTHQYVCMYINKLQSMWYFFIPWLFGRIF
jgi:hypothetical protein